MTSLKSFNKDKEHEINKRNKFPKIKMNYLKKVKTKNRKKIILTLYIIKVKIKKIIVIIKLQPKNRTNLSNKVMILIIYLKILIMQKSK